MFKKLSGVVVGAVLAVSVGAAHADPARVNTPISGKQKLPGVIVMLQKRGVLKVIKKFDAAAGLTGLVLKERGRYLVVYGLGDYLISGDLIDANNQNLTPRYYAKYVPKPDYGKIVKQIEQQGTLITLSKNKAAPVLYVFEDPNCIFCYHFNEATFPEVEQGKIQLKIVLVGFLKADSMARATAILAAKDPVAALRQNEAHYMKAGEQGGYPAPKSPIQKFVARIQLNEKLMIECGFTGTPGIIYRDKSGKWHGLGGMPHDKSVLSKIIAGIAVTQ